MKNALRGVAQDITRGLILEMESHQGMENSLSPDILDLLLEQLAQEMVRQLRRVGRGNGLSGNGLAARLEKVERKLEKLAVSDQDDDEDETAEAGSGFPNLKYARPKYKNVESILKYVERDEDKGGVKLVIMNFND